MPRGYDVLKNPSMYSKKRLDRALKHKARMESKGNSNAALTRSETVAAKHGHRDELSFDRNENVYRIGSMKIDMFDPDNADEIVRRFNAGDA